MMTAAIAPVMTKVAMVVPMILPARSFAFHVGHGTGDGCKHQRHHDAEHHVDEHRAEGLYDRGHTGASQPTSANDHYAQHDAKENINS